MQEAALLCMLAIRYTHSLAALRASADDGREEEGGGWVEGGREGVGEGEGEVWGLHA